MFTESAGTTFTVIVNHYVIYIYVQNVMPLCKDFICLTCSVDYTLYITVFS